MKKNIVTCFVFVTLFSLIHGFLLAEAAEKKPDKAFSNYLINSLYKADSELPLPGELTFDELINYIESDEVKTNWKKRNSTQWIYTVNKYDEFSKKKTKIDILFRFTKNKQGQNVAWMERMLVNGKELNREEIGFFYGRIWRHIRRGITD